MHTSREDLVRFYTRLRKWVLAPEIQAILRREEVDIPSIEEFSTRTSHDALAWELYRKECPHTKVTTVVYENSSSDPRFNLECRHCSRCFEPLL